MNVIPNLRDTITEWMRAQMIRLRPHLDDGQDWTSFSLRILKIALAMMDLLIALLCDRSRQTKKWFQLSQFHCMGAAVLVLALKRAQPRFKLSRLDELLDQPSCELTVSEMRREIQRQLRIK